MPTDFGEIARYNQRIATRLFLRAHIERNSGKNSEAEYHAQLAARYLQAAQEQWIAMRQEPGHSVIEVKKPRPWAHLKGRSLAASQRWSALQRLARILTASIADSISRREATIQSLPLN